MIIKSLSRKARGSAPSGGRRGGGSPFAALTRYMNRGIEEEEGRAVLWHNFFGSDRMTEREIVAEFEANARLLEARKNGNVLYHEILSFSRGYTAQGEVLDRMVADIGQEYLRERAADQLGYGVIHRDTDHVHLHLMISANEAGKSNRVRLSKKEFSEVQKRVEQYAIEHYPDMAQTRVYAQERGKEKLKTDAQEQAMKVRTGLPSRKEQAKATLHQIFARASSFEELGELAKSAGISFYQRGKSTGVIIKEADGTERRHRLSSLGVEEHYRSTNERLLQAPGQQKKEQSKERPARDAGREERQQENPAPSSSKEESHDALRREADELLSKSEAKKKLSREEWPDARQESSKDESGRGGQGGSNGGGKSRSDSSDDRER